MPYGMGGRVGRVQADGTAILKMTENCIYLIRHRSSGLVKIGITQNWPRRCTELSAGFKCEIIKSVFCSLARDHEKRIHLDLDKYRLPQSEWFYLSEKQIQELAGKIILLGEENKWRPGQRKKRKIKSLKPVLLLPYPQTETWIDLLESSQCISAVDAFSDAVVIYGLQVRCYYDGRLLLRPVGYIEPTANGTAFVCIKTWNTAKENETYHCDNVFELLRCIEAQREIISSARNNSLCLTSGTKVKWRTHNQLEELQNELESYFSTAS